MHQGTFRNVASPHHTSRRLPYLRQCNELLEVDFFSSAQACTLSRVVSVRHPHIVVLSPRLEALHPRYDDRAVLNCIPIAVPTVRVHEEIALWPHCTPIHGLNAVGFRVQVVREQGCNPCARIGLHSFSCVVRMLRSCDHAAARSCWLGAAASLRHGSCGRPAAGNVCYQLYCIYSLKYFVELSGFYATKYPVKYFLADCAQNIP